MNNELERLIEIGRRRGSLTVDDLQRHLPLEALSRTQLAEVLTKIEDAGVSLEIGEALTRGHRRKPADQPSTPSLSAEDDADVHRRKIAALGSSISSSRERAARTPTVANQYKGGTLFLGMAVAVCLILLVGLWLVDKGL